MRECTRCGEKPGHAFLRWVAVLALGAALEAEAVSRQRHSHTFSHATRHTFRVEHPVGKGVFIAGWVAFSAWWVHHVVAGGPR